MYGEATLKGHGRSSLLYGGDTPNTSIHMARFVHEVAFCDER
jgi:hypothetical protein